MQLCWIAEGRNLRIVTFFQSLDSLLRLLGWAPAPGVGAGKIFLHAAGTPSPMLTPAANIQSASQGCCTIKGQCSLSSSIIRCPLVAQGSAGCAPQSLGWDRFYRQFWLRSNLICGAQCWANRLILGESPAASQATDVGSIPIARSSIPTPVVALPLPGFFVGAVARWLAAHIRIIAPPHARAMLRACRPMPPR